MNSGLKLSLLGFGGVLLFCGAFVGFAKARGAELHDLPLLGPLFSAPDGGGERGPGPDVHPDVATAQHAPAPRPEPPRPEPAKPARASLLDAFSIESPYDAAELQQLVDALEASHREAETRLAAIAAREAAVEARESAVADKEQELAELKARLETLTQARGQESAGAGDPRSRSQAIEELTWRAKSGLFADGDAETLAPRLASYPAIEAARILSGLPPERAQELLGALPEARWREYAEAYASMRALVSDGKE
jgi:hypothetical protein